jgi:tetratricopeptide (TPR) repeat protein
MKPGHNRVLIALLAAALLLISAPAVLSQTQPAQKPQAPPAQTVEQETQEYTEEEYDAYEKAVNEKDLDKRGDMLLAFMEKYPQSKLQQYIVTSFLTLMYDFQKEKRYDKLEIAAERWLKYFPSDLQTIAYVADAARQLGHDQKFLDYGQKIYAVKPDSTLAFLFAETYKKMNNTAKQREWVEKTMAYPEYAGRFDLWMEFVDKYSKEKQFDKAAEFAELTLKAIASAKKPDTTAEAAWRDAVSKTKRGCYYLIGVNSYDKDKYADAIRELEKSLAVDPKFDMAYYYIGLSQWKLGKVENDEAPLSFAKAYLLKGEFSEQAKEHLEKIYKAIHNNTTIGIDKLYKRAETELASDKPSGNG